MDNKEAARIIREHIFVPIQEEEKAIFIMLKEERPIFVAEALNEAIASLEAWDKVKKEIKEIKTTDVNRCKTMAVHIINKHLGETKINKRETEECNDIETSREEQAMKIIYTGYSQHDAEAHYDCPYCGRDYGGWELFRDGISQGSVFICKECHKKIMY